MRGRVWGKEKEALLSTLPPPFLLGSKGRPQAHLCQEALKLPQELPHARVCMCVCLRRAVLPGRELWPPPAWGLSGQCFFCQSRDSGGQSLRERAPEDGLYLSPVWGLPEKEWVVQPRP